MRGTLCCLRCRRLTALQLVHVLFCVVILASVSAPAQPLISSHRHERLLADLPGACGRLHCQELMLAPRTQWWRAHHQNSPLPRCIRACPGLVQPASEVTRDTGPSLLLQPHPHRRHRHWRHSRPHAHVEGVEQQQQQLDVLPAVPAATAGAAAGKSSFDSANNAATLPQPPGHARGAADVCGTLTSELLAAIALNGTVLLTVADAASAPHLLHHWLGNVRAAGISWHVLAVTDGAAAAAATTAGLRGHCYRLDGTEFRPDASTGVCMCACARVCACMRATPYAVLRDQYLGATYAGADNCKMWHILNMSFRRVTHVPIVYHTCPPDDTEYVWASHTWRDATWLKVTAARQVVSMGYNVLLSDLDVSWLADPLPWLLRHTEVC
jgi:Nucleotide-diphospho-sugar transferase